MLRRVLGSVRDAAWLRRQFTRDAEVIQDVRFGVRLLYRNPLFSLLTITVLALGIGATVGIVGVVDGLMLRELPYRDADQIVVLFEAEAANRDALDDVAPGTFLDWRAQMTTASHVSAAAPFSFTYLGGAEPEVIPGAEVTAGFFETFGVNALHGRTFTADEFQRGRDEVIVLSHSVWAQRFGADPRIIGQSLRLNGRPRTVIGVMPPTFVPRLLLAAGERGIWVPKIVNDYEQHIRGSRFFNVIARLKPGNTREQAQAELEGISRRLAQQYPRSNRGWTAQVVSLRDHLAGRLRPAIGLLLGCVGLLLFVALANTANLLIARNAIRSQEIAVRGAVGAGRFRLVRQFAAETLLLAWLGCAAGLAVAYLVIRMIVQLAPADIPALAGVGLDGRLLLFAAALATLVAVVIGVVPAWHRSSGRTAFTLRGHGRGEGDGVAHHTLRTTLVVGELAVALILLAGAGLLLRSFTRLLDTSPGFNADRTAVVQIFASRGKTPAQLAVFFQQVIDRMRSLPEVTSVGAVLAMPFIESNVNMKTPVIITGRAEPAAGDESDAFISVATPGYFQAMQIPLLEGRLFENFDRMGSQAVAIVSETFARREFRSDSPLNHQVKYQFEGRMLDAQIVCIVGDVRHDGLDRPARAEIFVPHAQVPYTAMTFVARTTQDPMSSIRALRAQVHAVDPTQPIYRAATLSELVDRSLADRRFMLALLLAFAILAVTLAAAGVYGVISVLTLQRTREFGVRLALGAAPREILGMVVRQGGVISLVGLGIGLGAALIVGRVMKGFLYGVTPADPVTLTGVVAILAGVALVACAVPALRAARVDPVVALRSE